LKLFGGRKYPVKKESGRSARQRAFELFGEGQRPAQICKVVPISLRTACRYFQDYKKIHTRVPYATIRKWMRQSPEFSEKVIVMLADGLEMSQDEVVTRMQKPWGLLEGLKGGWPDHGLDRERTEIEDRLMAALEVVKFAEIFGRKDPQTVRKTLMEMIIRGSDETLEK
jgi:hypothetical protein